LKQKREYIDVDTYFDSEIKELVMLWILIISVTVERMTWVHNWNKRTIVIMEEN